MHEESENNLTPKPGRWLLIPAVLLLVVLISALLIFLKPRREQAAAPRPGITHIAESGCKLVRTSIDAALDYAGSIPIPHYEIPAGSLSGEEPDPDCYGTTTDPGSLQWLLKDAQWLLDGQDTLFQPDIAIMEGTEVTYYLDRTIFAVSWKQVIDNFIYTFAEVKVRDPSQFRRYLVNGEFNSRPLYTTARMAPMVNAVVASSGDYYRGRKHGIVVYEGTVYRFHAPEIMDICFVDEQGNLILKPRGSFTSKVEAQQFVDDNAVSFSLSFGPILIDNGERCEPESYAFGEINDTYPRAALCQRDDLHYVVVTANGGSRYWNYPTIHDFAENLAEMGFRAAYAIDGGNTGTIVMNDTVQNPISLSKMRAISDCLYFATAFPAEEKSGS